MIFFNKFKLTEPNKVIRREYYHMRYCIMVESTEYGSEM